MIKGGREGGREGTEMKGVVTGKRDGIQKVE